MLIQFLKTFDRENQLQPNEFCIQHFHPNWKTQAVAIYQIAK